MENLALVRSTTLCLLAMMLVLALSTLSAQADNLQLAIMPGTISGVVSYPSDYIPPMRIYAIASDGTGHYQTKTGANQRSFTIRNVPPGKYYVVAYTDEAAGMVGGWSRAVPCGLRNTCKDHALISVIVAPGSRATGIRVFDWYAPRGAFPSEPSAAKPARSVANIRSLDFRNFSYRREGADDLVLRQGKETGEGPDGSRLLSIRHIDFNGDGNEEALITIATGRSGAGGYSEEYFVYSQRDGTTRQVFRESREKPQSMRVSGQSIIIVAPFWRGTDPACCPSALETAIYSWRSDAFVRISRRLSRLR